MLLPNGDLYLLRPIDNLRYTILTTTLSRQAACHLLNSIDQAGFFDYDPLSYHGSEGTDGSWTLISVQAWREMSVDHYNFTSSLWEEARHQLSGWPPHQFTILPAVRATYRLLDEYSPSPGALHLLKPERLGVWGYAAESAGSNDYIEWPLSSRPLTALGSALREPFWGSPPAMFLTREDAARVYDALGETFNIRGTLVREGDRCYQVFARPLLPNEFVFLSLWLAWPPRPVYTENYVEWPLTSHTLAAKAADMMLTGGDAARVIHALRQGVPFREGDKLYQVQVKLLSGEALDSVSLPEVSLSCSPADGWQAP